MVNCLVPSCLVVYNECKHGKFSSSEMTLWTNLYPIMLICVLSLCCRNCQGSRDDRKSQIGREYCEKKRLKQGARNFEYNSFLWSLEREGSPPVYLFGTIHAPSHLVWQYIPQNSQAALLDATHVFTEVNLKDPETIASIRNCRQLPGNLTIKDVLPQKLFNYFKKVLKKFKARSKRWKNKISKTLDIYQMHLYDDDSMYKDYFKLRPMWLTSTILQQWNRFFIKQQLLQMKSPNPHHSLDSELVRLASDTYRGGIEQVSSHCDPMNNLATDKVNLAFNVTLQALDRKLSGKFHMKDNDIRHVINLYKCGDPMNTNRLETLFRNLVSDDMSKQLAEIDEYMRRELMLRRNKLMSEKIDRMLKNKRYKSARLFYAVGAAHLLGNDSVVTFLQKKGYKVRHIKPKEDIPATIKISKVLKINKTTPKPWWTVDESSKKPEATTAKNDDSPNIIFITKYQKNYYYYNQSSHPKPPGHVTMLITVMMTVMVWLLCAGS